MNPSTTNVYQTDLQLVRKYLYQLVVKNASGTAVAWLDKVLTQLTTTPLSAGATHQPLYMAFGMAARQMDKQPLSLTEEDLKAAHDLRPGFSPAGWNAVKATRALLVLTIPTDHPDTYRKLLDNLFAAADVNELEALYASLPLLPYPEEFRARASEGIRSNIRTVFDAIALDNPYPADFLDENAWNQLVLKSVFIDRPLNRIYGFDERRNPSLARMLSDFAHERWAAGRTFPPQLWRAVAPFVDESLARDLAKGMGQPHPLQPEAVALACAESTHPAARTLLATRPDLQSRIASGELNWDTLSGENH